MTKTEEIMLLRQQKAILLEIIQDLDCFELYEYDYEYDLEDNVCDDYRLFNMENYIDNQMNQFYEIEEKLNVKK